MKIGVSLPEDLVDFADEAAKRRGTSGPGFSRIFCRPNECARRPGSTWTATARGDTRLSKASVANVYDVQKVLRLDFMERAGVLPATRMADVAEGLRLVLDL